MSKKKKKNSDYVKYKDGTKINTRFVPHHNNQGLDAVSFMASPASSQGLQIQIYSIALNRFVEFAAFVTNFQDSYSSNYDSTEVIGRMDPILNFRNTTRTISLSFDVPSLSLDDARINMAEINALVQFLYPTYERKGTARTMSGSPLVKVQFQNIIASGKNSDSAMSYSSIPIKAQDRGLISAITSLSCTPDFDQGTFGGTFDLNQAISSRRNLDELTALKEKANEQALNAAFLADAKSSGEQYYGMQFPKLWKVDMSLTVLHDHLTGHGSKGFSENGHFPYYGAAVRKQEALDGGEIDFEATYNALPKPPPSPQVQENQPTKADSKDTETPPAEKLANDGINPEVIEDVGEMLVPVQETAVDYEKKMRDIMANPDKY